MKLYKVDGVKWEVREVDGTPWPGKDSEGDTCYENSHYRHEAGAWGKLAAEAEACIQINARMRKHLRDQLAMLDQQDAEAEVAHTLAMRKLALLRDA